MVENSVKVITTIFLAKVNLVYVWCMKWQISINATLSRERLNYAINKRSRLRVEQRDCVSYKMLLTK